MTSNEYEKEVARLVNIANNLFYETVYLHCQMNLDNPTPINKSAYRKMSAAVQLTENAARALQAAAVFRYDPKGKQPAIRHCDTCRWFGTCKRKMGDCDAWEVA